MLAEHKAIMDGRIKEGQDIQEYMKKHPQAKFAFVAEDMENDVSNMNATLHKLRALPSTPQNKETIKKLEDVKVKMMFEFNKIINPPKPAR